MQVPMCFTNATCKAMFTLLYLRHVALYAIKYLCMLDLIKVFSLCINWNVSHHKSYNFNLINISVTGAFCKLSTKFIA